MVNRYDRKNDYYYRYGPAGESRYKFEISLEKWCKDVKEYSKNRENNKLPSFSDVVDSYKEFYVWYKKLNLERRGIEERRKAAEKNKPEKEPEFTNDGEKDNDKANAYLESYKTYFSKLSKIMGKRRGKNLI